MPKPFSFSVLDVEGDWAGVDAWESPNILSAAEAHEAKKNSIKVEGKLKDEESKYQLLAASTKEHLADMSSLLLKLNSSTATKDEMERLAELNVEIAALKIDLLASKSAVKSYREDFVKSIGVGAREWISEILDPSSLSWIAL